MDKKLRETTYLCVEIMNRKRQVQCKRETWSRGRNLRLPFDVIWCLTSLIDLFSLYVLFSQYRSCDNTLENCFFQISSCSRAYVRTKRQSVKFPWDLYWEIKNIQAKEVYTSQSSATRKPEREVGGGRVTQEMLAPPRGPTPYHLIYHFSRKRYPFLLTAVNSLSFKKESITK